MQDAFSHVEVTTCDPKDILMLRSLIPDETRRLCPLASHFIGKVLSRLGTVEAHA